MRWNLVLLDLKNRLVSEYQLGLDTFKPKTRAIDQSKMIIPFMGI